MELPAILLIGLTVLICGTVVLCVHLETRALLRDVHALHD